MARPISRFKQTLQKSGLFVGAIVLAACSTFNPSLPAPTERVASMRDLRAAVNTFVPTGKFNPTSYVALSGTRTPDGKKIIWSPFIATFAATPDGKFAWHYGGFGNTNEAKFNAAMAGVRMALAGGKIIVGAGTTHFGETFTRELAAKFKLPKGIEMTFSTDARDMGKGLVSNVKVPLGKIMETAVTLSVEHNRIGEDHWRVGPTFERGRWAFDHAYDSYLKTHTGQLSFSFGKQGEHFLALTPVYDQQTGKISETATINWTFYGRRGGQPRRVPSRRGPPARIGEKILPRKGRKNGLKGHPLRIRRRR